MRSLAALNQLSVFVRIAELGSLSAAGRELNLSPSAVSKRLSQLEERLGMLLIKRTTRSLTLTDSGRILFERANDILSDVENTIDAARQLQRPEGELRVTCSLAFGTEQLMPLMGRYLQANPEVNANVSLNDKHVNLAEENFDIAMRITTESDSAYAARKLAVIHWVYCASPEYLADHKQVESPECLAEHDCLVYPGMTSNGGAWSFVRDDQVRHVGVRARLISNSSLALRRAALQGQGVACLPTYLVSQDLMRGDLSLIAPEYRSAISHTLYAMYYRSKFSNALVRSFIDFVVDDLGPVAPWDRDLKDLIDISTLAR